MANLNQTGNYYMENMNAFSTNEERVYAKLQDLQDSMAATIRNFPDVMDADVFITPGENRAYILDSGNVVEATAAVSVTMVEGKMLTDGQGGRPSGICWLTACRGSKSSPSAFQTSWATSI